MPDLEPMPLQSSDFYKTAERVIYKDYQCNCQKKWQKDDRFIVYVANENGIEEIINKQVSEDNIDDLLDVAPLYLTNNMLISGGHTVVNLNDRFSVSREVETSAKFCIDYIVRSVKKYNIHPDFLMEINDFYMEKSDGNEIDGANGFRKMATSPYIIPEKINSYICDVKEHQEVDVTSLYVSEKNMADRFKRHIKNRVDKEPYFSKVGNSIEMTINGNRFDIITNNKPTCAAGNAATFRAIRYNISSNKVFDNYTSHIGVFPLCSRVNVLNGYLAAVTFYHDFKLPCLLVFFGKSCFD